MARDGGEEEETVSTNQVFKKENNLEKRRFRSNHREDRGN